MCLFDYQFIILSYDDLALQGNDSFTRLDGLIVLRTVLCSTTDHTDYIIENELPVFLSSILTSPNEDVRIEAAWYVELSNNNKLREAV